MCGKDTFLAQAMIEGSTMSVCKSCVRYGQVLKKPIIKKRPFVRREEPQIFVTNKYSQIIRKARDEKGLKQDQLAIALREKLSVIQKVESGHLKPSITLARKLEQYFQISLIEKEQEIQTDVSKNRSDEGFTIKDFMKK